LNFPVHAGDWITDVVFSTSPTVGNILMINNSTQKEFSLQFSAPSGTTLRGDSVEWIVERPGALFGTNSHLTNYQASAWFLCAAISYNGGTYQPSNALTGQVFSITMLEQGHPTSHAYVSDNGQNLYVDPNQRDVSMNGDDLWFF